MKSFIHLWLAGLAITGSLASCQSQKDRQDAANTVNLEQATETDAAIADVAYVPLETNEQSLIGNIDKIVYQDGKFYVLDKFQALYSADYADNKDKAGKIAHEILGLTSWWGLDLTTIDGFEKAVADFGGKTYSPVNVVRIWGGEVNPPANGEQLEQHEHLLSLGIEGLNSVFDIPEGANHSDTQLIGIDAAVKVTLGL